LWRREECCRESNLTRPAHSPNGPNS
jgi:hypothetical protein